MKMQQFNSESLPFAPVTLGDQAMVERYMRAYGESSCQHSFTALFTLQEKYGSRICEKDGFLFVLREKLCSPGERVYLAPMGGGDRRAAYAAILSDAHAYGCRAVFQTLTEEHSSFLQSAFPGQFTVTEQRDYAEYIYSTEALCSFAGKQYADKRNKIHKLQREYEDRLSVRRLSPDDAGEIMEAEREWFLANASPQDREALYCEMLTIKRQLDCFEQLGLSGIAMELDGEMVAFAYGVALNDSCFDGLIAKASREIPNLYKLLYREISRLCAAPCPYFNWEEDVGVEGLRRMKTEYGPIALLRKYLVSENAPSETQ